MLPAMKPQEVTDALKLSQLKDKVWYVVPSCATTGEGLFEGLVCLTILSSSPTTILILVSRVGCPTTSSLNRRSRLNSASAFTKAFILPIPAVSVCLQRVHVKQIISLVCKLFSPFAFSDSPQIEFSFVTTVDAALAIDFAIFSTRHSHLLAS